MKKLLFLLAVMLIAVGISVAQTDQTNPNSNPANSPTATQTSPSAQGSATTPDQGTANQSATDQTTTTTTTSWTNDQGTVLREYSTTKHYPSYNNQGASVVIGSTLPGAVTVYPLPGTVKVEHPDRYDYAIVNEHPVVVERQTRRVIHTWP
jgi:hypothetical protein